MKCKVFSRSTISELETEINGWFRRHPNATVCFVTQSESMDDEYRWSATYTILYRED